MSAEQFSMIIILAFSVILHELGHGYGALWLGDPTARNAGRLTLNPLPHIDLFSTILLPAILVSLGLPAFGGAKPVPVDPHRFHVASPRRGMMLVAAAGPLVNLLLGLASLALFYTGIEDSSVRKFAYFFFLINMNLMVFNLLPIPPLDGSKVLAGFFKRKWAAWIYRLETPGLLLLMLLVMTGALEEPFKAWMLWLNSFIP